MPDQLNIPAIAKWVAKKLPKGHPYYWFEGSVGVEIKAAIGEAIGEAESRWKRVAIAESLLLDALAASERIAGLLPPIKDVGDVTWVVDVHEDDNGITPFDGPTRLSALLAAVQAIVGEEQP